MPTPVDPKRDKIIIEISEPTDAPTGKKEEPRLGMLPGQYPNRRPRRRRGGPPVLDGIYTQVYDMGLLSADDGTDIPYRQEAIIDLLLRPDGFGGFEYTGYRFLNTNYTATYNAMFTAPTTWADTYTPINELFRSFYNSAFPYPLAGSYNPSRGWRTGGGSVIIPNKAPWHYFNTLPGADAGLGYTKITTEFNYGAPSLGSAFTQDRDGELYLAPRVFLNFGISRQGQEHTTTIGARNCIFWYANGHYIVKPRSYFLSNALWNDYTGDTLIDRGFNNYYPGVNAFPNVPGGPTVPPITPLEPVPLRLDWRTHNIGLPGARLRRVELDSGGGVISDGAASPASFPSWNGTSLYDNAEGAPHYFYRDTQQHDFNISPGLFLGAMKLKRKGSTPEQWYYFWRRFTISGWNLATGGASAIGGGSFSGDHWDARV